MNEFIQTILNSFKDILASIVKAIPGLLGGLVVLMLTRYVAEWSRQYVKKVTDTTVKSSSLQILFTKVVFIGTWIVGIAISCVLAFPGLNLGQIVGALGLSSVAIGFAFQDIFKNFLAGILLLLQEPFSIGDEIIVDDYQGVVQEIDVRTTTIKTYQGEKVLIPNSTIFTDSVQVVTGFGKRRTDLGVGLDYNTSLDDARKLLLSTVLEIEDILDEPKPEIDIVNFGDSSIDFVVRYWTLPQQKKVRQIQTKAILAIKKACDKANLNIPYPIRTLYYYDQEKFDDYLSPESND